MSHTDNNKKLTGTCQTQFNGVNYLLFVILNIFNGEAVRCPTFALFLQTHSCMIYRTHIDSRNKIQQKVLKNAEILDTQRGV